MAISKKRDIVCELYSLVGMDNIELLYNIMVDIDYFRDDFMSGIPEGYTIRSVFIDSESRSLCCGLVSDEGVCSVLRNVENALTETELSALRKCVKLSLLEREILNMLQQYGKFGVYVFEKENRPAIHCESNVGLDIFKDKIWDNRDFPFASENGVNGMIHSIRCNGNGRVVFRGHTSKGYEFELIAANLGHFQLAEIVDHFKEVTKSLQQKKKVHLKLS